MSLVLVEEIDHGVAIVTLNDPARRNAMGVEMAEQFRSAIEQLRHCNSLRAVILTGAGEAFAAGGDLKMLKQKTELDEATNRRLMLEFYHSFLCVLQLPVPTVAAINGHAIGAGLCLALACDARVVADHAKLGLTFTRLGLHPGMGATLFLPRIVGATVANEWLISGRVFAADDALQWGLVNRLVPASEVLPQAIVLAESFVAGGLDAVSGLLRTLRPSSKSLQKSLEREAGEQARNYASQEFSDRVDAAMNRN